MPQAVQCPRCRGDVSVTDDVAGQRVQCPHCGQGFLAPGLQVTANDDDDWLNLDSDKPTAQPAASKGKLSKADEDLLAEFTDDLDDFTSRTEKVPSASNPQGPTSTPNTPKASTPPVAAPLEFAKEYRVACNICGSSQYATSSQAGKTIKCSDCHSPILVPPPPKIQSKSNMNLDNAETFQFQANEDGVGPRQDPFKKSADEYLEEASREEVKSPKRSYKDDDVPDAKEWIQNVFGILRDPGVVIHWIGFSVIAAVPAYFAMTSEMYFLRIVLFPVGLLLGVFVVSCGFAILQSVANRNHRVTDWPLLDPFSWIGQTVMAAAATLVSGAPVWLLTSFLMDNTLISIAMTMFSVYILFPFVLLSMLDMDTPLVPFSAEVARSVTKCEDAWGGFYFSSALIFIALYLLFLTASTLSVAAGTALAIPSAVGAIFVYFSMIGRLAFSIGQAVNDAPMVNDIDRKQRNEV